MNRDPVLAVAAWTHDLSEPWTHDLSAPWTHDLSEPWTHDLSAPWTHDLSAPWTHDLSAPWTHDLSAPWTLIDVADLPGASSDVGQFEAVEHISGSTVGALCEDPPLLLAVNVAERKVVGHWRLVAALKGLRKRWRKDAGSRGEGMVFGPDRVFVIKEKQPAARLEFGPAGAESDGVPSPGTWTPEAGGELHAIRHRRIDADDISDATVVDGQVRLLSDQERSLIAYPSGDRYELPDRIGKPEGVARTHDGRWLIAEDNRSGQGALHLVDDDEVRRA